MRQRLERFRATGDGAGERAFLDRIWTSMGDISRYLQRLKQRFTQWFNRRRGRRGVLWDDREGTAPGGGSARKAFSREAVLAVLAARGKVSLPEYLQMRVRYFADGAVLGTREYVDGALQALRSRWGSDENNGALAHRSSRAKAACALRGAPTLLG